jgi:hypothetical protein
LSGFHVNRVVVEDVLDSQVFNWYINTFHVNGLTTYISRLLNKAYGVDYATFYDKFYTFLNTNPWFIQEQSELRACYNKWMTGGKIDHPDISNIEIHGWNIVHLATIKVHADRKSEYVFDLIEKFVKQEFEFDPVLLDQLIKFQKLYVINYDMISQYPVSLKLDYDFLGYLQDDTPLETPVVYTFDFFEDKDISIERFLENIYFSRKRNFGKALITKIDL